MVRYRFSGFTLSPQRRLLLRDGHEVPLIPRYFDLLLLLVQRRREAVHRREIFERVWGDVIVSESALTQAVRTIRRTLDDDPREPRFIRTVSRHGYQFVFPEVIEEEEDAATTSAAPSVPGAPPADSAGPAPLDGEVPPLRRAAHAAARAWMSPAATGGAAGFAAGCVGGLLLAAAPASSAPIALAPVLGAIGGACGALGGAGVGAGLALGAAAARSHRTFAVVLGGAAGGGLVGAAVQLLGRWGLSALVGLELETGGGVEGLLIGGAAGVGIATVARRTEDAAWVARGDRRLRAVLVIALCCGLAGLVLTLTGRPLVGGTIHAIAQAAEGSSATLEPLGRLFGEPEFGPVSRGILAFGEAAVFGAGLAVGVIRRRGR